MSRSLRLRVPLLGIALAVSSVLFAAPAAQAAPALELPFVCGTSWEGDSGGSSVHRNNEIDFNKVGTSGDGDLGEPVVAAAAGTIRWEGGAGSAYGNYVEIDHGGGYSTLYAHLEDKHTGIGDTVRQGQLLGTVGNTDGNTSGLKAHLHFEFRNRGGGQGYPGYIRPASFHGNAFDYSAGKETFVSQNCDTTATLLPGMSATSRATNGLDVFASTTSGYVKHRNLSGGDWSCWTNLPQNAKIKGEPAAIATPGRIDVFALGIDNRLKRTTWTVAHNGWYNWVDLGPKTFSSAPGITKRSDTLIDVFAKDSDDRIAHRPFSTTKTTDGGWVTTDWKPIGGNVTLASAPSAVASPDGNRITVLARGVNGSLMSLMWTEGHGWWNWADRDIAITGTPAAISRGGNSVSAFLRTPDGAVVHKYTPDGTNWDHQLQGLGGHVFTSPAVVSPNPQRIDVFSRNNEADLIRRVWTGSTWSPWAGHGAIGAPCS